MCELTKIEKKLYAWWLIYLGDICRRVLRIALCTVISAIPAIIYHTLTGTPFWRWPSYWTYDIFAVGFVFSFTASMFWTRAARYGLAMEKNSKELAEERKKLQELSFKDHLTGLYNIRFLEEGAKIAFRNACRSLEKDEEEEFTVFVIDINDLKFINDTYGHAVGDIAIKFTVNIIKLHFSRATDFIYRSSGRGDEFWAICSSKDPKKHYLKIKEALSEKIIDFKIGDERIRLSASIGYAHPNPRFDCYHQSFDDGNIIKLTNELLATADSMMYQHKATYKKNTDT